MHIPLDRDSATPLVQQLTQHLQTWITQQRLRPGARLPSIRTLARDQCVSASCVIEAYDRLVASGWLEARHGTGFFVAERKPGLVLDDEPTWGEGGDGRWRQFREGHDELVKLGCGWLPAAWRAHEALTHAIRQVSRASAQDLFDYCPPLGLASLRQHLHKRLARQDINAGPERILTTQGASHGLDLLVRTLLRPGDTVLVENPGYFNLFNLLRQHQVRMLPVPRTVDGPCVATVERLLAEHRPRCLFVNSLYHNPTGTSLTPKVAYRLLELAREHDLRIVEDDIYADFQEGPATRLATLDSEQRVIYLASFSKTLSSSLRVGYMVADAPLLARLAELKMVTGIGTSRFAEQVVGQMLANGSYRKSTQRLRVRLGQHMARLLGQLEQFGWEVLCEPCGGMFVWARVPGLEFARLEQLAREHDVLLTPGSAFDYQGAPSPWLRINVAYGQDSRAQAFFQHAGRPSAR
ncbi:PLP-dependent aminotransferase family protein [Pseudomonas sp. NyZ480]|uniref:aminotransferase-like domain-containing protein n=1 Tax=Pseudomonas sp. NyZ480 TaxID=3035289 RepID=UPI0024091A05|nr:PLP-dependent aminotransferase family protein [Pseudomonas sp. NyZ480]WEZ89974.1 PLP-dependent aminotransferase family protein [Pseudomonas sp. NyZ480]